MGQHIQSEWEGYLAIHRWEDLPVIRQLIENIKPTWAVELGTAQGGFAAMLASVLDQWGGQVHSFDIFHDPGMLETMKERYKNLTLVNGDVLNENAQLKKLVTRAHGLLYTDNGNKQRELELWVPCLMAPAMVGTHDYGTEIDPAWAEAFMASQGYQPYNHETMANLAHPEFYPVSLTRFWIKS